jgi:hypothetical protein
MYLDNSEGIIGYDLKANILKIESGNVENVIIIFGVHYDADSSALVMKSGKIAIITSCCIFFYNAT